MDAMRYLIAASLIAMFSGCGTSAPEATTPDSNDVASCVNGRTDFCDCPDGTMGVTTCASGTWGACECSDVGATDTGTTDTMDDTTIVEDTFEEDTFEEDTFIPEITVDDGSPAACDGDIWTRGDHGSTLMKPGGDCIGCHLEEREGPRYTAAGTVAYSMHNEDDCNGAEGVTVRIIDADGGIHDLRTNGAGNFYTREAISVPYTAATIVGDEARWMVAPQTDLNCATCHTQWGAEDAPGRIIVP